MPNSTITCAYTLNVVGARAAADLEAAMAAVPVDQTLPDLYGLLLESDITLLSGQIVTRTFVFKMTPDTDATAHCTLVPGDASGSPVDLLALDGGGANYAQPPIITFDSSGQPVPIDQAAQARAVMGTNSSSMRVVNGGAMYTAPTIAFSGGGLVPGGVQATGHVSVIGGAVSVITVDTPGGPYTSRPIATITDSTGSGAEVIAGLTVTDLILDNPGVGYTEVPGIIFTPVFKSFFPDTSDQRRSLAAFMQGVFNLALGVTVQPVVPVIA